MHILCNKSFNSILFLMLKMFLNGGCLEEPILADGKKNNYVIRCIFLSFFDRFINCVAQGVLTYFYCSQFCVYIFNFKESFQSNRFDNQGFFFWTWQSIEFRL